MMLLLSVWLHCYLPGRYLQADQPYARLTGILRFQHHFVKLSIKQKLPAVDDESVLAIAPKNPGTTAFPPVNIQVEVLG